MADKPTRKIDHDGKRDREDRLKAALKANLARRKAQSRARDGQGDKPEGSGKDKDR